MAKQTVALYTVTSGDRVERARSSLAEALGGATLGDPDEAGVFEVSVDAESPDAARALVREAFSRAGTGDDFVLRETTEGREIPADDPRQAADAADRPDPSARVADAASAVAAAAAAARSGDSDAADAAKEAASDAASSVREAATGAADSVREAVDEKGFAGAASDYASTAAGAADQDRIRQLAPLGALLLLLIVVRRLRR